MSQSEKSILSEIVERELARANRAKRQAPLNSSDLRQAFSNVAKAVVEECAQVAQGLAFSSIIPNRIRALAGPASEEEGGK